MFHLLSRIFIHDELSTEEPASPPLSSPQEAEASSEAIPSLYDQIDYIRSIRLLLSKVNPALPTEVIDEIMSERHSDAFLAVKEVVCKEEIHDQNMNAVYVQFEFGQELKHVHSVVKVEISCEGHDQGW